MRSVSSTLVNMGAIVSLWCVLGTSVHAQDRGMVAICPVVFDKGSGTSEAQSEAIRTLRSKLEHAGFKVADYDTQVTRWKDLGLRMPREGQAPTASDLTKFGAAMGAKFVLEPEFDFNVTNTPYDPNKYTTVKADLSVFKASDGMRVYHQSETVSKSPKSSGDFGTLSQTEREQRVVDQAVDTSIARFLRRAKPATK